MEIAYLIQDPAIYETHARTSNPHACDMKRESKNLRSQKEAARHRLVESTCCRDALKR